MACDNEFSTYSCQVHGISCDRGSLWLTENECIHVNNVLKSHGYMFKLKEECLDEVSSAGTTLEPASCTTAPDGTINPKKRLKRSNASNLKKNTPSTNKSSETTLKSSINQTSTPATRMSRRLRKSITGSWINACSIVTDLLEKEPVARWLQVDPVNNPEYLEKVFIPMNLQTVRQKLAHGLYTHPFRWQEDIRTIFYNIFSCNSSKLAVWQETAALAAIFEQLCKDYVGVNPYAVYAPMPSTNSSVTSSRAEQRKAKASFGVNESSVKNTRSNTIVLEESKLRELLAKVAAAASSNAQPVEVEEATPVYTTPRTIATLPSPTLPPPPLPPVKTLRPGEKGPSVVHKRLSQAQFRQLDVHLRYALLDLVKDEFGVSPEAAACDPDFIIDFELLPYLKQKLIVMYLRTLLAFQQKSIEEGYQPTLVTSLQQDDKSSKKHYTPLVSNVTPKVTRIDPIVASLEKEPLQMVTPLPDKQSSSSSSSISFDSSSSSSSFLENEREDNEDNEDNVTLIEPVIYGKTPKKIRHSVQSTGYYGDRGKSVPCNIKPQEESFAYSQQHNNNLNEFSVENPYFQSYYSKDQALYSVRGKTRPAVRSQLEDKLYESPDDDADADDLANNLDVAKSVNSSWGEWKAKVIQNKIQLKLGDEKNKELFATEDTERERDAELANAEI